MEPIDYIERETTRTPAELVTHQVRIQDYGAACSARARAMDLAYWAAAASPLPALVVLALLW